ncbi:NAD(P)-binding protein [Lepidopterella palustris CBS 459.81]|uniref:NAD(P)-binding protein n=1 Tax=Lepidopterella palustris CBS 459.81 TaxID=1314670 RepID=A0A8E2EL69_9PEZI|nr:NAD(P)-binding protein [Lepidopterella palustris CBS 459.81]
MVNLITVQQSNSQLKNTSIYPSEPVAVIAGGTSGIGKATAKAFAKSTVCPRVYILGRSQESADRVIGECKALNPKGTFKFIGADLSLIKNVDDVCERIKRYESRINPLILSTGMSLSNTVTEEKLHRLVAMAYYSRIRMAQNLLHLLSSAAPFARVVVVGAGGREGHVHTDDLQGLKVSLRHIRGHITAMITLALEKLAQEAPTVSFVHDYPGTVRTALFDRGGTWILQVFKAFLWLSERWLCVPIEECGERHVFLSTTPRYAPAEGSQITAKDSVFRGSDGQTGSGVYSVGWDCESSPSSVETLLATQREDGTADAIWRHTMDQFARITAL